MTQRALRFLTAAAATAAVVGGAAAPAVAAQPVIERLEFEEADIPETSFSCDFPVLVSFSGVVIIRTFPDRGSGVVEVDTANFAVRLVGEDGTSVRVRNVGADVTRVTPDGDVLLTAAGQVPFPGHVPYAYKGVLRIDLETGDVILEPSNTTTVDELCEVLSAP
jgi:hypothetical protein